LPGDSGRYYTLCRREATLVPFPKAGCAWAKLHLARRRVLPKDIGYIYEPTMCGCSLPFENSWAQCASPHGKRESSRTSPGQENGRAWERRKCSARLALQSVSRRTAFQPRRDCGGAAGWRGGSLFNVCDLPKGLSFGKALARACSPAACRSTSRLR